MQLQNIQWAHPSTTLLTGPSNSGKTQLLSKILKNKDNLFEGEKFQTILFYSHWQPIYKEWLTNGLIVHAHQGVPNTPEFKALCSYYTLANGVSVIFDDLGSQILKNLEFFEDLFVVLSHHMKIAVFLVLHNLYERGLRKISLNSTRIILTNSSRDSSQIQFFARQSFPRSKNFLPSVYKYICENQSYGYLVLDFSQNRSPYLKVTSNWFSHDSPIMAFVQDTSNCNLEESKTYLCYYLVHSSMYNLLTKPSVNQNTNTINNSVISSTPSDHSNDFQSFQNTEPSFDDNMSGVNTVLDNQSLISPPSNSLATQTNHNLVNTSNQTDQSLVNRSIQTEQSLANSLTQTEQTQANKPSQTDYQGDNTQLEEYLKDNRLSQIGNSSNKLKNIKKSMIKRKKKQPLITKNKFTTYKSTESKDKIISPNKQKNIAIQFKDEKKATPNSIRVQNDYHTSDGEVKSNIDNISIDQGNNIKNVDILPKIDILAKNNKMSKKPVTLSKNIKRKKNISMSTKSLAKKYKLMKHKMPTFTQVFKKNNIANTLKSGQIDDKKVSFNKLDSIKLKQGRDTVKRTLKLNLKREIPIKKMKLNQGEKRPFEISKDDNRKKMKTYNAVKTPQNNYEAWRL